MDRVGRSELQHRIDEVLRRVAQGESLVVVEDETPLAVLLPLRPGIRPQLLRSGRRLRLGSGLDLGALPVPTPSASSSDSLLGEDRG